jgi:hypothetical protein
MEFRKHNLRNKTNKYFIVIAIGFLATALAGVFIFQVYISSNFSLKTMVYITIENDTDETTECHISFESDTIIKYSIAPGKYQKFLTLPSQEFITFTVQLDSGISALDSLSLRDSVAYLFIKIAPETNSIIDLPKMQIHATK